MSNAIFTVGRPLCRSAVAFFTAGKVYEYISIRVFYKTLTEVGAGSDSIIYRRGLFITTIEVTTKYEEVGFAIQ